MARRARVNVETNGAAPANVYAFSKAIMDNLASRAAREIPDWIIVGLRYFNVYGPREAHKGVPASMVYASVAADEEPDNARAFSSTASRSAISFM